MLTIFTSGVALLIAFGIVMHARLIIVANAVTLMLAGATLGLNNLCYLA